jgi:hypothetical protein
VIAPVYTVLPATRPPEIRGLWDGPAWHAVPALELAWFHPAGSGHRPRTRVKLLHSRSGLHALFRVEDRFVRCVHTRFQDAVYRDSCVELFLQPRAGKGYLNFEINCGGALLASHVTNWRRRDDGRLCAAAPLTAAQGRQVAIWSSLPAVTDPEIAAPVSWQLELWIPLALLEACLGPLGALGGQCWRANVYKCADGSSHPHWAAWSPVDALNFHLPRCFGSLLFG